MSRHSIVEGIILRGHRLGEIHKSIVFLTPDAGLLNAVAYGAYSKRGKLRGVSEPFTHGRFHLYHDPVKDRTKVEDVEVLRYFHGIREDVTRYFCASLWAEVVLASFGGGEGSAQLFQVLRDGLALLSEAGDGEVKRLNVQVLLRYLAAVGAPLKPKERESDSEPADTSSDHVSNYIERSLDSTLSDGIALDPPPEVLAETRRRVFRAVQLVVERPINTLRTAKELF